MWRFESSSSHRPQTRKGLGPYSFCLQQRRPARFGSSTDALEIQHEDLSELERRVHAAFDALSVDEVVELSAHDGSFASILMRKNSS